MVGTGKEGLHLQAVDSGKRRGAPPVRFSLDYDTATHSDEEILRYIASLELPRTGPLYILIDQRLVVDGHEIFLSPPRFGEHKIPWRVELNELLNRVPAYVRLTLRNLNRVHTIIQSDEDDVFYMLDSNARL